MAFIRKIKQWLLIIKILNKMHFSNAYIYLYINNNKNNKISEKEFDNKYKAKFIIYWRLKCQKK